MDFGDNNGDYDNSGTWETVTKNRRAKDKKAVDEKATTVKAKKPGMQSMRARTGAASNRKSNYKGTPGAWNKKGASVVDWRAVKKKADSNAIQKKVLLKSVKITSTPSKHGRPVGGCPSINSPQFGSSFQREGDMRMGRAKKNVQGGARNQGNEHTFDSFQEYTNAFPDLPGGEEGGGGGGGGGGSGIIEQIDQVYNDIPPFYDLNGCNLTEDVLLALNGNFMNNPHNSMWNSHVQIEDMAYFNQQGELCAQQFEGGMLNPNSYSMDGSYHANIDEQERMQDNMSHVNYNQYGDELSFGINEQEAVPNVNESYLSTGMIPLQEEYPDEMVGPVTPHGRVVGYDRSEISDLGGNMGDCSRCVRDVCAPEVEGRDESKAVVKKKKKKIKAKNKDQENNTVSVDQSTKTDVKAQNKPGRKDLDEKHEVKHEDRIALKKKNDTASVEELGNTAQEHKQQNEPTQLSIIPVALASSYRPPDFVATERVVEKGLAETENESADTRQARQKTGNAVSKSENENNNCQETVAMVKEVSATTSDLCEDTLKKKDGPNLRQHMAIKGEVDGRNKGPEDSPHDETKCEIVESVQEEEFAAFKGTEEIKPDEMKQEHLFLTPPPDDEEEEVAPENSSQQKLDKVADDCDTDKTEFTFEGQHVTEKPTDKAGGKTKRKSRTMQKEMTTKERNVTYGEVIDYVMKELKSIYAGKEIDGNEQVTEITDDPLPAGLTSHVAELRRLSMNYVPSWNQDEGGMRHVRESPKGYESPESFDVFEDKLEDDWSEIGEEKEASFSQVENTDEHVLRKYREKLRLYAKVNHLHEIASNPQLRATLAEWMPAPNRTIPHRADTSTSHVTPALGEFTLESKGRAEDRCVFQERSTRHDENHSLEFPASKANNADVSEAEMDENGNKVSTITEGGLDTDTESCLKTPHDLQKSSRPGDDCQQPGRKGPTLRNNRGMVEHSLDTSFDFTLSQTYSPRSISWGPDPSSPLSSQQSNRDTMTEIFCEYQTLLGEVVIRAREVSNLDELSHFLELKMIDTRSSLERDYMNISDPSIGQDGVSALWHGGDVKEMHPSSMNTPAATVIDRVDDNDMVAKGWMDKALVEDLSNPRENETSATGRGQQRTRKFRGLANWWIT